jgi:hypothetical protein
MLVSIERSIAVFSSAGAFEPIALDDERPAGSAKSSRVADVLLARDEREEMTFV